MPTNHSVGLLRGIRAAVSAEGNAPVLLVYLTSGAVGGDRITLKTVQDELRPALVAARPRLRLAVLAADLRHLRSECSWSTTL